MRQSEVFDEQFAYYLSIGMTEEQYWDKDCTLVKHYRKAEELRQKRLNHQAWLQGMYVYDAIARISPILHDFAKSGTKAEPYPDEPYPIGKKQTKQAKKKKELEAEQKGLRYMQNLMTQNNRRYKKE